MISLSSSEHLCGFLGGVGWGRPQENKEGKATKDAIASISLPPAGFGLHCPDASIVLCSENKSF